MRRMILAGVVLAVMLTGGAAAGPLEDGVAAINRAPAEASAPWQLNQETSCQH
jgi:hypothetical protein